MAVMEKPQHLEALDRANDFRCRRADLKREIKAGEVSPADILQAEIPEWLEAMKVADFLLAIHRLRSKTLLGWLYEISSFEGFACSPTQPVGRLTERQRDKLSFLVREWEAKRERERRS